MSLNFSGISIDQQSHFKDQKKIIEENTKFPSNFDTEINYDRILTKQNLILLEREIQRIFNQYKIDDEFLISIVISCFENRTNVKDIYLTVLPDLNNNTFNIMQDIYSFCIKLSNDEFQEEEPFKDLIAEIKLQEQQNAIYSNHVRRGLERQSSRNYSPYYSCNTNYNNIDNHAQRENIPVVKDYLSKNIKRKQ
eukprot:TRINITY_DN512_c0_g1_i1.p1 TRINITY_DN512_c0_g1~~TRINITY_DN512_c0_g1_i1.p1  ORF type:complete len:204 (+),score=44.76 TRINITY_DN512_c0_g1_i1:31-612(+)